MQEEHVAVADGENEVRHTDYIYMVSDKMLVISMIAELDHHLADEMREVIDDVIDVRGVEDIIFDFSRINFMDSAGIGLIMGRYRKIHEKGRIYVAGAGEGISRILLISGLHKLVVVSSDVNDAAKKILESKRNKNSNSFEIIFDSKSENESFARVVVAAFCTRLDPTLEEISDIKTAVSEAVTNCIVHGYEGREGKISLKCELNDNELTIEVHDDGVGIDDIERAMEPMYTSKPQLERSGMGFSFMEAFMDELHVKSGKHSGTTVMMKKKIGVNN